MKNIFKKFSYVLWSNLINAFSKLLIIILITKILTEYDLGVYTFALALTAPVTLFFNMKMGAYIVTNNNIDFNIYSKLRSILNFISITSISFLAVFMYLDIFFIILLVSILKIIEINTEFYQAFPNKEKLFEVPAKLKIVKVIISTILFFITLLLSKNLTLSLLVQTIFLVIFLVYEKDKNLSLVHLDRDIYNVKAKTLFLTLLPLGIVQTLLSFSSNIPKYLLEILGSFEEVGIFSGILYIVTIFNLLMATLIQTLLPYMKDIYCQNVKRFNLYLNIYVNIISGIIGIVFIILSYYLGEILLTVLFNENFANYSVLLYIFSFTIALNMAGSVYDAALLLSNSLKLQPYFLIFASVITLILGIILVHEYGIIGAGYTLVIFNILNTLFKCINYNFSTRKSGKHA